MQLILVALRRRAAFEITDVRTGVGNDQRAFELAGVLRVDAEIRRQFHRAANAFRDVDERTVAENCRVQRRVEVVAHRNDAAEVFLHQRRVFVHRFRERTEHHAGFGELRLERGADRDAVEHRVHRDTCERFLLVQRNAELFVGAQQFGVDFVERFAGDLSAASGPRNTKSTRNRSAGSAGAPTSASVRCANVDTRARRHSSSHSGSPLRAEMKRTTSSDKTGRQRVRLDVGDEAGLVFAADQGVDGVAGFAHDPIALQDIENVRHFSVPGRPQYQTNLLGYLLAMR